VRRESRSLSRQHSSIRSLRALILSYIVFFCVRSHNLTTPLHGGDELDRSARDLASSIACESHAYSACFDGASADTNSACQKARLQECMERPADAEGLRHM
jgi:hypothetical protein